MGREWVIAGSCTRWKVVRLVKGGNFTEGRKEGICRGQKRAERVELAGEGRDVGEEKEEERRKGETHGVS